MGLSSLLARTAPAHAKSSANPGQWSSPGLDAPEDPAIPKFFKTESGVKVQELAVGSGDVAAAPGDTVLFDYVLRRSNGYFICELGGGKDDSPGRNKLCRSGPAYHLEKRRRLAVQWAEQAGPRTTNDAGHPVERSAAFNMVSNL